MSLFKFLKSSPSVQVSQGDRADFASRQPMTRFDLPEKTTRMEDLIAEHPSNQPFNFISVNQNSLETKQSLLGRMRAGRQQFRKNQIPVGDLPILTLNKNETTLTLSDVIPKLPGKDCWLLLKEAHIHLGVSRGFNSSKSSILIELLDNRNLSDEDIHVASITVPNNQGGDYCLPMTYSVHEKQLDQIKLRVYNQNTGFEEDTAWGSLQIELVCQSSRTCFQVAQIPVIGQLHAANTNFRNFKANPNHIDLTYDGEDLKALGTMYRQGLILDHTAPVSKKPEGFKRVGSEAGSGLNEERGKDFGSDDLSSTAREDNERLERENRDLMSRLRKMEDRLALTFDRRSQTLGPISDSPSHPALPSSSVPLALNAPDSNSNPTAQENDSARLEYPRDNQAQDDDGSSHTSSDIYVPETPKIPESEPQVQQSSSSEAPVEIDRDHQRALASIPPSSSNAQPAKSILKEPRAVRASRMSPHSIAFRMPDPN